MSHYKLVVGMVRNFRNNLLIQFYYKRQNHGYLLRLFIAYFTKKFKATTPILSLFMLVLALPTYASPPTELLSFQEGTQVTLTWKAPTDTQAIGYAIYKGTSQNALARIATVGASTPSGATGTPSPTLYTDTTVTVGSTYFYKISVIDSTGVEGNYSAITATSIYQLSSTYHSDGILNDAVVGDFNGDGIPDLALGFPYLQSKGKMYGQVIIYFGGTGRKQTITTLNGEQIEVISGKALLLPT